jgi:cytochrome P450 family 6
MVQETVEYREKNDMKRNDFMQLLIQLKNKGTVDSEWEAENQNGDNEAAEGMCIPN